MKNKSFKDILTKKYIQVYHGSDMIVDNQKIRQPVRALDFGQGFYTTTNKALKCLLFTGELIFPTEA